MLYVARVVHGGVPNTITAVLLLRNQHRLLTTNYSCHCNYCKASFSHPVIVTLMGLKRVISTFLVVRR